MVSRKSEVEAALGLINRLLESYLGVGEGWLIDLLRGRPRLGFEDFVAILEYLELSPATFFELVEEEGLPTLEELEPDLVALLRRGEENPGGKNVKGYKGSCG